MTQPTAVPAVTLADVRDLATLPVWHDTKPSAAAVLGIGRTLAYAMAERGDLPTIRLGSRVVVSVPKMLALLGERPVSTDNQDRQAADLRGDVASHGPVPAPLTAREA